MAFETIKVLLPAALAFLVGIAVTPTVANFLYRNKMWKPKGGKVALDGTVAEEFNRLHAESAIRPTETGTPRLGGSIIWIATLAVSAGLWLLAGIFPNTSLGDLEFLSRSQTWVPLAVFALGALVGLADDLSEVRGGGGLSLSARLSFVAGVGLLLAFWFYDKLEVTAIVLPGWGPVELGWLVVPVFLAVVVATYASGVIDGLDGLAGGVFSIAFAAYAAIAFAQGQPNLAALSATIAGATLAFLWFNIPPARFYMSETGSMALTLSLATVAMMSDDLVGGVGLSVLPLVAMPLAATVAGNLIQVASKKLRGKKVFRVAPVHHHFEAIGWTREKVVMRYWVVAAVAAVLGVIVSLAHIAA
jgi:phospho-N-acetylmuramoyl-pentapeptide-transferase